MNDFLIIYDEEYPVLVKILYRSFADNPDLNVVSMAKNNDVQMFQYCLFPDVFKDKGDGACMRKTMKLFLRKCLGITIPVL